LARWLTTLRERSTLSKGESRPKKVAVMVGRNNLCRTKLLTYCVKGGDAC